MLDKKGQNNEFFYQKVDQGIRWNNKLYLVELLQEHNLIDKETNVNILNKIVLIETLCSAMDAYCKNSQQNQSLSEFFFPYLMEKYQSKTSTVKKMANSIILSLQILGNNSEEIKYISQLFNERTNNSKQCAIFLKGRKTILDFIRKKGCLDGILIQLEDWTNLVNRIFKDRENKKLIESIRETMESKLSSNSTDPLKKTPRKMFEVSAIQLIKLCISESETEVSYSPRIPKERTSTSKESKIPLNKTQISIINESYIKNKSTSIEETYKTSFLKKFNNKLDRSIDLGGSSMLESLSSMKESGKDEDSQRRTPNKTSDLNSKILEKNDIKYDSLKLQNWIATFNTTSSKNQNNDQDDSNLSIRASEVPNNLDHKEEKLQLSKKLSNLIKEKKNNIDCIQKASLTLKELHASHAKLNIFSKELQSSFGYLLKMIKANEPELFKSINVETASRMLKYPINNFDDKMLQETLNLGNSYITASQYERHMMNSATSNLTFNEQALNQSFYTKILFEEKATSGLKVWEKASQSQNYNVNSTKSNENNGNDSYKVPAIKYLVNLYQKLLNEPDINHNQLNIFSLYGDFTKNEDERIKITFIEKAEDVNIENYSNENKRRNSITKSRGSSTRSERSLSPSTQKISTAVLNDIYGKNLGSYQLYQSKKPKSSNDFSSTAIEPIDFNIERKSPFDQALLGLQNKMLNMGDHLREYKSGQSKSTKSISEEKYESKNFEQSSSRRDMIDHSSSEIISKKPIVTEDRNNKFDRNFKTNSSMNQSSFESLVDEYDEFQIVNNNVKTDQKSSVVQKSQNLKKIKFSENIQTDFDDGNKTQQKLEETPKFKLWKNDLVNVAEKVTHIKEDTINKNQKDDNIGVKDMKKISDSDQRSEMDKHMEEKFMNFDSFSADNILEYPEESAYVPQTKTGKSEEKSIDDSFKKNLLEKKSKNDIDKSNQIVSNKTSTKSTEENTVTKINLNKGSIPQRVEPSQPIKSSSELHKEKPNSLVNPKSKEVAQALKIDPKANSELQTNGSSITIKNDNKKAQEVISAPSKGNNNMITTSIGVTNLKDQINTDKSKDNQEKDISLAKSTLGKNIETDKTSIEIKDTKQNPIIPSGKIMEPPLIVKNDTRDLKKNDSKDLKDNSSKILNNSKKIEVEQPKNNSKDKLDISNIDNIAPNKNQAKIEQEILSETSSKNTLRFNQIDKQNIDQSDNNIEFGLLMNNKESTSLLKRNSNEKIPLSIVSQNQETIGDNIIKSSNQNPEPILKVQDDDDAKDNNKNESLTKTSQQVISTLEINSNKNMDIVEPIKKKEKEEVKVNLSTKEQEIPKITMHHSLIIENNTSNKKEETNDHKMKIEEIKSNLKDQVEIGDTSNNLQEIVKINETKINESIAIPVNSESAQSGISTEVNSSSKEQVEYIIEAKQLNKIVEPEKQEEIPRINSKELEALEIIEKPTEMPSRRLSTKPSWSKDKDEMKKSPPKFTPRTTTPPKVTNSNRDIEGNINQEQKEGSNESLIKENSENLSDQAQNLREKKSPPRLIKPPTFIKK